jgi:hypothetical protein
LNTLQQYLRTIHNRDEIDDTIYNDVRPQSTRPARADDLPKTHKHFDQLYHLSAPLLTQQEQLLNLRLNTFDAVNRIHNISPTILSEAYRFVSFDVTSLFTNIPLHKILTIS